MSEFDQKANDAGPGTLAQPATPASPVAPSRPGLLQRKLLFGLSLPWLAGAVLLLLASGWYLFAPDGEPDVNQLAFGAADTVNVAGSPAPAQQPSAFAESVPSSPDLSHVQDEVAGMVKGAKDYAMANRQAITLLADTVKAQGATLVSLNGQIADLKAQLSEALTRQAVLEAAAPAAVTPRKAPPRRTPLSGMTLISIQDGMAWVRWQGKTWAVKSGDRLGEVAITAINAADRQVQTSAGILKDK